MASEYVSAGVAFLRSLNIAPYRIDRHELKVITRGFHERLAKSSLHPGDVVVVRTGRPGTAAVIPEDLPEANCADLVVITPGDRLDAHFIAYYLNSRAGQVNVGGRLVGSVQSHFNIGDARRLRLPLPPIETQRAIGRTLQAFDDKIELNRRMNETLEATARAVFKPWFVDFDLVRAKAFGQSLALDESLLALFPTRFARWDGEDLPVGWKLVSVADIAQLNGWTLRATDELDPIEYIDISSVSRGERQDSQVLVRGTEPSRARRRVQHGDTVVSTVRPERASYFLAIEPPPNLVVSTGFVTVTPKRAPWSYVHAALAREEVFEQLGHLAHGGAYPAVNPSVVGELRLPMPSDRRILDAFHEVVAPLYQRAAANRRESYTLGTLRDALLPKLISGEVRVREAEEMVT
jgi:type I restriction enzyme S subunit